MHHGLRAAGLEGAADGGGIREIAFKKRGAGIHCGAVAF